MLSASSISAANCFTPELDLEDPLRSFAPDAGKEMDDTHQDAEPLAPIVCVATSFQPTIEFLAIAQNFPVQDEPPVREVLPDIEKAVAKEVIAIDRREVPVESGGYLVPQFSLWHEQDFETSLPDSGAEIEFLADQEKVGVEKSNFAQDR